MAGENTLLASEEGARSTDCARTLDDVDGELLEDGAVEGLASSSVERREERGFNRGGRRASLRYGVRVLGLECV